MRRPSRKRILNSDEETGDDRSQKKRQKMEENMGSRSVVPVFRPVWRTVAPGLNLLRLPRT